MTFGMPPAYRRRVDLDDLKFGAMGLLFASSGVVGLLLALNGIAVGIEAAAALAVPAMGLLAVGRTLDAERRWSLRLARPACVAAGGIWAVAGATVAPSPEVLLYCAAIIGGCRLAWGFLDAQLHGPPWAREGTARTRVGVTPGGWIEELPDAQLTA
jgi:hypothetical protein